MLKKNLLSFSDSLASVYENLIFLIIINYMKLLNTYMNRCKCQVRNKTHTFFYKWGRDRPNVNNIDKIRLSSSTDYFHFGSWKDESKVLILVLKRTTNKLQYWILKLLVTLCITMKICVSSMTLILQASTNLIVLKIKFAKCFLNQCI